MRYNTADLKGSMAHQAVSVAKAEVQRGVDRRCDHLPLIYRMTTMQAPFGQRPGLQRFNNTFKQTRLLTARVMQLLGHVQRDSMFPASWYLYGNMWS